MNKLSYRGYQKWGKQIHHTKFMTIHTGTIFNHLPARLLSQLQLQNEKAQHSVLIATYTNKDIGKSSSTWSSLELWGLSTKTIQKNLWQTLIWITINLDYHKIKTLTHKLNEHSIRHASALIKTRYALQCNTSNNSQELGLGATAHAQPHNPLTHINFFLIYCAVGGCLVRAPK